jgi:hypothetical protein
VAAFLAAIIVVTIEALAGATDFVMRVVQWWRRGKAYAAWQKPDGKRS